MNYIVYWVTIGLIILDLILVINLIRNLTCK